MFTVSKQFVEYDNGHHKFYYVEGKKIPKAEDPNTYVYIDRSGILQCTDFADVAYKSGGGVYIIIPDEKLTNKNGDIVLNGKEYSAYGTFEDSKGKGIYISKSGEKHYFTRTEKTVVVHPNSDKEAYDLLYQMYTAIEAEGARAYDI